MRIATGCALLLLLGLGAGCSKNETVKRVKALADKSCACTDAACADAVEKEYLDLVKEGQKRGSEDDRKEVADAYSRMRTCIAKARTGAGEKATEP
jgi:hypothetical protein